MTITAAPLARGRLLAGAALNEIDREHQHRTAKPDPVEHVGAREGVRRNEDRQRRGAEGDAHRQRQRREGKADDAGGADEDAENIAGELPGDQPGAPCISMLGSITNRNGMKNVLQPTITAVQPVVQPDTRAILAAA